MNDELAVTFANARAICAQLDSTMVSIHSKDEEQFIKDYLSHNLTRFEITANYYYRYHVWLGGELSPPGSSNVTWFDGSPFNYSDWDYPRHPSRECADPEACCALSMVLTKRNSWIDFNCNSLYSVACQRPIPQKFEQFKPQEVYDSNSAFSANERFANCFLMAPAIFVTTAATLWLRSQLFDGSHL